MNKKIFFILTFLLTVSFLSPSYGQKRGKVKSKQSRTVNKQAKKTNVSKTQEASVAQEPVKDTIKPGVVTITSAFKPSLRTAAKINFTATQPVLDSSRFALTYSIPAQNLFFIYQPVPIKPLALAPDSALNWQNQSYVKAGFGNFSTPYIETGLSFGNPNAQHFTVFANYVSSKGPILYQEFTKANISANAIFNNPTNQVFAGLSYQLSNQYKYGTNNNTLLTKDALKQNFNTIVLNGGVHSKENNEYGIGYHPTLELSLFSDNKSGSEFGIIANAPITKTISKALSFDVGLKADVSSFKNTASQKINNNIFNLNAGLNFNSPNAKISAAIQPTWNNGLFTLLPNITAEGKLSASDKFTLMAGWISYFQKNTYRSLATVNPYIAHPTELVNTKISEQYAGFKGSIDKHVTFNAKVALLNYTGMPLYVNDTVTNNTQTFLTLFEPSLSALRISGEIAYTLQEKLTVIASTKITQFTKQEKYDKAFGFLPLEISGTMRYKLLKDVVAKADIFFWGGSPYRTKQLESKRLNAVIDLNAGAEFSVLKNLNIWIDVHNILNNQYQRWNQYDVLGFNIVGGVAYRF